MKTVFVYFVPWSLISSLADCGLSGYTEERSDIHIFYWSDQLVLWFCQNGFRCTTARMSLSWNMLTLTMNLQRLEFSIKEEVYFCSVSSWWNFVPRKRDRGIAAVIANKSVASHLTEQRRSAVSYWSVRNFKCFDHLITVLCLENNFRRV